MCSTGSAGFELPPAGAATAGLRIGLTGGIGSGKSTVAALLAAKGAAVIDTDAISRRLTSAGGEAVPAIRAAFGDDFIDAEGGLDRTRMRTLVFADPQARRRLEASLHPLIETRAERQATAARAAVTVFDVPLLVESGRWRSKVDRVLVVDCSEDTQVQRVAQRAGWSADLARAVIAQQASRATRLNAADAVIRNEGISLDQLAMQVDTLWSHWCGLHAASGATL